MRQKNADKIEILAPAGSMESMKAAFMAGADAVYMGGSRFGARAYAENPQQQDFLYAIDYAHIHGRSLYLTLNTLLKQRELEEELIAYVRPLYEQGLDAVIVQDAGVMRLLRQEFPDLPLHASTQMTVTGEDGARAALAMGASRVVLARELSVEEIRRIREETGAELEVFVHGALCYCYSGQCLMSSLIGGRSGNRGRCAGTCRLPYRVDGLQRPISRAQMHGNLAAAQTMKQEGYALSLKDLCGLDYLPELMEAGVFSLKIEGRMKSPAYAAGVTSVYRKYADRYLEKGREQYRVEEKDRRLLAQLFDRGGFTDGYLAGRPGADMLAFQEKPGPRPETAAVLSQLEERFCHTELKEELCGELLCRRGKPLFVRAYLAGEETGVTATVTGQEPSPAQKRAVTREELGRPWQKTGDTPYVWRELSVQLEEGLFVPMSECNALRRELLEKLQEEQLAPFRRRKDGQEEKRGLSAAPARETAASREKRELFVYVEKEEQLGAVLACPQVDVILLDSEVDKPSWSRFLALCREKGKRAYLALPYIFRSQGRESLLRRWEELERAMPDGFLVRTLDEAQFIRERGFLGPLLAESSLYTMNRAAREEYQELFSPIVFTAPLEEKAAELSSRGMKGDLLLLYGYLPMMVTAGCIQRSFGGCRRQMGYRFLEDRKKERFPVSCRCKTCCNVIYNSRPLSLLGCQREVEALSAAGYRLNFTVENEEETRRLLEDFVGVFYQGELDHAPQGAFTRGHFKRGVE